MGEGLEHSKEKIKKRPLPSNIEAVVMKKKRGRPRKHPVLDEQVKEKLDSKFDSNLTEKHVPEKTKAMADSELASLIQSVQNSIQSQFAARDLDEISEFTTESTASVAEDEPSSLQSSSAKST